jgi:hypothetical protein
VTVHEGALKSNGNISSCSHSADHFIIQKNKIKNTPISKIFYKTFL